MPTADMRDREQGFNLLELAIVLALLGSVLMVIMYYRPGHLSSGDSVASGYKDQIVAAVYRYAERHFRLPCADTNGNGLEGGAGGVCSTNDTAHVTGGVPFLSLGLTDPTALGADIKRLYIYGVYRNSAANADLAQVAERTGDVPGDSQYRQLDDLRYALHTLTSTTVDGTHIYTTGDGGQSGIANCGTNRVANLAFFVAYAGDRDADANGNPFDGANSALTWPTGGSVCVAGQTTRSSELYDDTVAAVGFAELLGYLTD